jgi:hypothetical protein
MIMMKYMWIGNDVEGGKFWPNLTYEYHASTLLHGLGKTTGTSAKTECVLAKTSTSHLPNTSARSDTTLHNLFGVDSTEYINEPSGSAEGKEFLHQLNEYQCLKEESVPCS